MQFYFLLNKEIIPLYVLPHHDDARTRNYHLAFVRPSFYAGNISSMSYKSHLPPRADVATDVRMGASPGPKLQRRSPRSSKCNLLFFFAPTPTFTSAAMPATPLF